MKEGHGTLCAMITGGEKIMCFPTLVVAADWSTQWSKRWMARAEWDGAGYQISSPVPVGAPEDFLMRIRRMLPIGGSALIGFDFPIGLPEQFVERKFPGQDFRAVLEDLGDKFLTPTDKPNQDQPFGPASSMKGFGPNKLAEALGFGASSTALLRKCDLKSNAHPMFHTLGARQVGRAAIDGWRNVIQPNLKEISLWPFSGHLANLLGRPGLTLAEIYPAMLFYDHSKGSAVPMKGKGKETAAARKEMWQALRNRTEKDGIKLALTLSAEEWIEAGFASSDDFDAMAGVLGMLRALKAGDKQEPPLNSAARRVEGWMLGLDVDSSMRDDTKEN